MFASRSSFVVTDTGSTRPGKMCLVPHISSSAPALLAMAERHFRRAFHLLSLTGSADQRWDPVSSRRSAIEADGAVTGLRRSVDSLIDIARDAIVATVELGAPGSAVVDAWIVADVPILRRLALYGWAKRRDVDGTAKITALRENEWLLDRQVRTEAFDLLEAALPTASQQAVDDLVESVVSWPSDDDSDGLAAAYLRFRVLGKISRSLPGIRSAAQAFEAATARHPEFLEEERRGEGRTFEFGLVPHRPPMSVQELHAKLGMDSVAALGELRRYEGTVYPSEGSSWSDALGLVRELVNAYPDDGFVILDVVGAGQPEIVGAAITGWSTATLSDASADRILTRLAQVDLDQVVDGVSRLLADGGLSEGHPTSWYRFPAGRRLASELWRHTSADSGVESTEDWLLRAINSAPGRLAEFWIQAIASDWKEAGDSWNGIPAELTTELEKLLDGPDERCWLAEVVVASQLAFFSGADRDWCHRHVLPLLDWALVERAKRTWQGHLYWGRWNSQLLEAGLLDQYLRAAENIEAFTQELRDRLCEHLAGVALGDIDPRAGSTSSRLL